MSKILRYIKPSHIKQVVKGQKGKPVFEALTKDWKKNLDKRKRPITKEVFWCKMVHARLTSQNKAELVQEFMEIKPFLLTYESVRSERDVEDFIAETVQRKRIGKYKRIGEDLATNLAWLEKGDGWKQALDGCNRLTKLTATTDEKERQKIERAVANYIEDTFSARRNQGHGRGFGPKQSRNLPQMLGLTRYETPIDSRVRNWLNRHLPPDARLDRRILSNRKRYECLLDDIQKLCRKAQIYPRIFDAAVVSAMDRSNGQELPPNC